ncbi:hypothetical protein [Allocoleopsis sp.]|uniref:hypothetical protein n=1 Tax=Allocoleopsis sp. TaxID=3088169 RepID=UPI002FD26FA4
MKVNQKLVQRLLLCLTPLVTGSVFVALPGLAATLATSQATLEFSNFSHNPLTIETAKTSNTSPSTNTNNSQVVTQSQSDANFTIDSSRPSGTTAFSQSLSTVQGNGSDYSGTAQSSARLAGYNFSVGAGETFSLDFQGLLKLNTSVDSDSEVANAFGSIAFQLFDANDLNNPLAFLTLTSGLDSVNSSDFLLDPFNSSNITFLPSQTSFTRSFGGNQESANANFTGQLSIFFNNTTQLILREFSSNSAGASCPNR